MQISGFPVSYVPDSTYLITIARASGQAIKNFNGSCRVGTTNQNAGVITSGTGTSTYSVAGETNGIHLSQFDQTSATFNWRAPAPGAGTVRLYIGAHQGVQSGPNTTIVAVSSELIVPQPPDTCSNPHPVNGATDQLLSGVILQWTIGAGTETHDIYFGTAEPLELFAGDHIGSSIFAPDPLEPATTYLWRVDSRNDVGTTPGPLWSFSTGSLPGTPSNPTPADGSIEIALLPILSWSPVDGATSYNLCFGTENPPPPYVQNLTDTSFEFADSLEWATTYYWEIGVVNTIGTTPGPIWSFFTIANASDDRVIPLPRTVTLGPVYPNPFNAEVSIPFSLPQSGSVRMELYNTLGQRVALLKNEMYGAGAHVATWNGANVGTGVYLLKLSAGDMEQVTKVVSMK